ncbi:hypothetical protein HOD08_01910 [bacterium]|nr:hypothetical protein [bacterium]
MKISNFVKCIIPALLVVVSGAFAVEKISWAAFESQVRMAFYSYNEATAAKRKKAKTKLREMLGDAKFRSFKNWMDDHLKNSDDPRIQSLLPAVHQDDFIMELLSNEVVVDALPISFSIGQLASSLGSGASCSPVASCSRASNEIPNDDPIELQRDVVALYEFIFSRARSNLNFYDETRVKIVLSVVNEVLNLFDELGLSDLKAKKAIEIGEKMKAALMSGTIALANASCEILNDLSDFAHDHCGRLVGRGRCYRRIFEAQNIFNSIATYENNGATRFQCFTDLYSRVPNGYNCCELICFLACMAGSVAGYKMFVEQPCHCVYDDFVKVVTMR